MTNKTLLLTYTALILLIVILPVNSITDSPMNDTYIIHIRLDYLGHILLFLPCLFLIRLAWPMPFFPLILSGLLFATATEGLQYLLPYRTFNSNDLLANLTGVLLGILLLIPAVFKWLNRRIKKPQLKGKIIPGENEN